MKNVELIPLFVTVAAGVVLAGYAGMRNLTGHNDIVINKGQPYQYQSRESPKWRDRQTSLNNYNNNYHPENKQ